MDNLYIPKKPIKPELLKSLKNHFCKNLDAYLPIKLILEEIGFKLSYNSTYTSTQIFTKFMKVIEPKRTLRRHVKILDWNAIIIFFVNLTRKFKIEKIENSEVEIAYFAYLISEFIRYCGNDLMDNVYESDENKKELAKINQIHLQMLIYFKVIKGCGAEHISFRTFKKVCKQFNDELLIKNPFTVATLINHRFKVRDLTNNLD